MAMARTEGRARRSSKISCIYNLLAFSLLLAPLSATAQVNQRMQIRLLLPPNEAPDVAVKQRLISGRNLQAMVLVPEASRLDGALLDPNSVTVEWNGQPQEKFVFYRTPTTALVFAMIDPAAVTEQSELTVTAKLRGTAKDADVDAGWRLPIPFSAEELTKLREAKALEGRTVAIQNEKGEPLAGAYLFGQRRDDLFAKADEKGIVILNAPARNSLEQHLVWAPGYRLKEFDPLREPVVQLQREVPGAKPQKLKLVVRDAKGDRLDSALLRVNNSEWVEYKRGKSPRVRLRESGNEVLVLAPGFNPVSVKIENVKKTTTLRLQPVNVPAAKPPAKPE